MDQNVIRNLAIIRYMHSFKGKKISFMEIGLVGQVMARVMKLWHLYRVGLHKIFIHALFWLRQELKESLSVSVRMRMSVCQCQSDNKVSQSSFLSLWSVYDLFNPILF